MKKFIIFIVLFTVIFDSNAQNLDSYRYLVVPEKFDFLKEPDQYQLNSLAKFLFEKYGFETFTDGEDMPAEFKQNRCEGLFANVANNSGLFRTRLTLTLKDCNNKIVFTSAEGTSGEKDFQTAYHEALRNALQSLETLNYSYNETIVSERPEISRNEPRQTAQTKVTQQVDTTPKTPVQTQVRVKPTPDLKSPMEKPSDGNLNFVKGDMFFLLKQTSNGYSLLQKGMAEPFAALLKSSAGNSYIYSSITSKGMAYFDENGNLVVEVLNPETNVLDTILYKAQF